MRECAECIALFFQVFPGLRCPCRPRVLVQETRDEMKKEKLRRKEDNLAVLRQTQPLACAQELGFGDFAAAVACRDVFLVREGSLLLRREEVEVHLGGVAFGDVCRRYPS